MVEHSSIDEYRPNIRRETDAALINRLSNELGTVPAQYLANGPMDWTPAVDLCVILSNGDDAAMVFEQTGRRVWQVMTIFGPTCRGRKAIITGKAMRDWMMPAYADAIFGPVPKTLRAATWFYRQMGGRLTDKVTIKGVDYVAPNDNEALFVLEAA